MPMETGQAYDISLTDSKYYPSNERLIEIYMVPFLVIYVPPRQTRMSNN
jgi:hypothetical protein